jgi:hypothetical protein
VAGLGKLPGLFVFGVEQNKDFNAESAEFQRGSFGMNRLVLLGLAVICGAVAAAGAGSQHTVSVTLNYDFTVDNACSSSVTTGCVKQFNIYHTSGGGTPVV